MNPRVELWKRGLEFTGLFVNKDRIPQYKGELHLVYGGAVSKRIHF
jgi:hypothetical protein